MYLRKYANKIIQKQLKLNACVPKSNSFEQYEITCDVIAYHLVHFFSVWVIHKCQSGVDFFTSVRAENASFMDNISMTSQAFSGKKQHGSETSVFER